MKNSKRPQPEFPSAINQTYDISYWARQWKVSVLQIAEAIRITGSNSIREIRSYLKLRELI